MDWTTEYVSEQNVSQITELALQLWPESNYAELFDDFSAMIGSEHNLVLLVKSGDASIGFAHIALRNEYVEGASRLPVAYLEGVYIMPNYQRQGVGQYLLALAEDWALAKGCNQLASDAELSNTNSQSFHQKSGFREVNRVVCFVKDLKNGNDQRDF